LPEFDINVGVTISNVYPPGKLDGFRSSDLAAICIPDGGHKVTHDWTYLVCKDPAAPETDTAPMLYGINFFRNKADATKKRGATQMSMLLFLTQPFFLLFKPIVQEGLMRFMDEGDSDAIHAVWETLESGLYQSVQFSLFDKNFILNIPNLRDDPCPGALLLDLVDAFKHDTMLIWHALLCEKRIVFMGATGEIAGNAALSSQLLVSPLSGLIDIITPFVALTDISTLERQTYICGTTNPMIAEMKQLHDMVADCNSGKISTSLESIKLSSDDKRFMKQVLKGVAKGEGEKWVRRQFLKYTSEVLSKILQDTLSEPHATQMVGLSTSKRVLEYAQELKAHVNEDTVAAAFDALVQAQEGEEHMTAVQLMKAYFNLDKELESSMDDVAHICAAGAVVVVAHGLESNSNQVRKYAMYILAKLATIPAGQIDIVSPSVLPAVVDKIDSSQPPVVEAAFVCLKQISALCVGAEALVKLDLISRVLSLFSSGSTSLSDTAKTIALTVLQQVYRMYPEAPPPPDSFTFDIATLPHTLHGQILELFDIWERAIDSVPSLSEALDADLGQLSSGPPNSADKPSVLHRLLNMIADSLPLRIQCAGSGVVALVLERKFIQYNVTPLSWQLLAQLADCQTGVNALISNDVVALATDLLEACTEPCMSLMYAACFLESVSQNSTMAEHMYASGALPRLVAYVLNHHPGLHPTTIADDADADDDGNGNGHGDGDQTDRRAEPQPMTKSERDFLLTTLPVLRTLKYMYQSVTNKQRRRSLRHAASSIGSLLSLDEDLSDRDRADFQTVLSSVLVAITALDISYLKWMLQARDANESKTELKRSSGNLLQAPRFNHSVSSRPSMFALPDDAVVRKGRLQRQAQWSRRWHNRWCVLTPVALNLYKSIANAQAHNVIPLLGSEVRQISDVRFDLITNRKTYMFRTQSPAETGDWITMLLKASVGRLQTLSSAAVSALPSGIENALSNDTNAALSHIEVTPTGPPPPVPPPPPPSSIGTLPVPAARASTSTSTSVRLSSHRTSASVSASIAEIPNDIFLPPAPLPPPGPVPPPAGGAHSTSQVSPAPIYKSKRNVFKRSDSSGILSAPLSDEVRSDAVIRRVGSAERTASGYELEVPSSEMPDLLPAPRLRFMTVIAPPTPDTKRPSSASNAPSTPVPASSRSPASSLGQHRAPTPLRRMSSRAFVIAADSGLQRRGSWTFPNSTRLG
jgi:Stabilization of polarity axis/PH domain